MAEFKNSYLAALLNDGQHQILPVSKAQLIELAKDQKGKFGDNVLDVAGALTYLLDQDGINLEAAKSYTGTSINNLAGSYTVPTGMVVTEIKTAGGQISGETVSAYLNAGDIKRTPAENDKVKATDVEAALHELADAIEKGGTGSIVTLEEGQVEAGYLKTYVIKQGKGEVGKINIPKDFLVKSGTVETVKTDNTPYAGAKVGEKYLDFVINTKDSKEGTAADEHIYIPVKDLTDIYTGTAWTSDKYGTSASVNESNQISVELNANTIAALKLADSSIQDSHLAEVNGGKVAKTGKAENVSVAVDDTNGQLKELVGAEAAPAQVQAALEFIAGKINTLNKADYVRSIQGKAGVNDGVTLSFTNTAVQKNGAAELQLTHNLGNTALLHYDSKTTNDGISEEFFNAVIKA